MLVNEKIKGYWTLVRKANWAKALLKLHSQISGINARVSQKAILQFLIVEVKADFHLI